VKISVGTLLMTAGAVAAVLLLTSRSFAHVDHHGRLIAALAITVPAALLGLLIDRLTKPKTPPPAPQRPVYQYGQQNRKA
jgi:hypothetical protein